MKIHKVENKDFEIVIDIYIKASRVGHPFLSEETISEASEMVRTIFWDLADIFILEENAQVQGFVAVIENYIGALFVKPQAHGLGYGRKLLEYAINVRDADTLEVFVKNKNAQEFYENLGFEIIGKSEEKLFNEESYIMKLK